MLQVITVTFNFLNNKAITNLFYDEMQLYIFLNSWYPIDSRIL